MTRNRSHLVPTTITNKNGVQTTVHKKTATGTTSGKKLPKAVIPTTTDKRDLLVQETVEVLTDKTNGPRTKARIHNRQQLTAALTQYSDATLHRFNQLAPTGIGKNLSRILLEDNPSEQYMNDWITIEAIDHNPCSKSADVINGLEKYNNLETHQSDQYSVRREEQVRAIARVTNHLINNDEGFSTSLDFSTGLVLTYVEDPQLRDLLTTHENPTAIADLIANRNITDAEQVTALYDTMNNTTQAISSGIL